MIRLTFPLGAALFGLALTAVILGLAAYHQWRLEHGQVVVLRTGGVDPVSLFRGHYVRLRYPAAVLRRDEVAFDPALMRGDRAHVVLAEGEPDGTWSALSAHRQRPVTKAGQTVLRGRVARLISVPFRADQALDPKSVTLEPRLWLDYGIGALFLSKQEAQRVERALADRDAPPALVELALDRDGDAILRALRRDGETLWRHPMLD